jgi:hypothetical protein
MGQTNLNVSGNLQEFYRKPDATRPKDVSIIAAGSYAK